MKKQTRKVRQREGRASHEPSILFPSHTIACKHAHSKTNKTTYQSSLHSLPTAWRSETAQHGAPATQTNTHTHIKTRAHPHTHKHTHKHAHKHTNTQTHTDTHTDTQNTPCPNLERPAPPASRPAPHAARPTHAPHPAPPHLAPHASLPTLSGISPPCCSPTPPPPA